MDNRRRAAMIRKIEKKVRSKYISRIFWTFLISLIVGIAIGILICWMGWLPISRGGGAAKDVSSVATSPAPTASVVNITAQPEEVVVTPEPIDEDDDVLAAFAGGDFDEEEIILPEITDSPEDMPMPETDPDYEDIDIEALTSLFSSLLTPAGGTPTEVPVNEPVVTPEVTPMATPETIVTPDVAPVMQATQAPVETGIDETEIVSVTPAPQPDETDGTEIISITPTPEPEVTAAPTVAPTPTPLPANALGGIENPIPVEQEFTFDTQVYADGTARLEANSEPYDTVSFTIKTTNYLLPDYFAKKYASQYKLTGTEAGASFDLTLVSSTGSSAVVPQNVVLIGFENSKGDSNQGYQLMDAEIAGNYGVSINPGETLTFYKRFAYSSSTEMEFMTLTYYIDGVANKVYFKLETVLPPVVYDPIKKGDDSGEVKTLQEKLIELKYLTGDADGKFGNMTESAVMEAQTAGGFEATGIAENDFLHYLYSDEAKAKEAAE